MVEEDVRMELVEVLARAQVRGKKQS